MQLLDQGSRARLTKLATLVRRLATDLTFDSADCGDPFDGLASDGGVARGLDLWPRLVSGSSSFNSSCSVSRATPSLGAEEDAPKLRGDREREAGPAWLPVWRAASLIPMRRRSPGASPRTTSFPLRNRQVDLVRWTALDAARIHALYLVYVGRAALNCAVGVIHLAVGRRI
jgi:hypothetical protein